MSSRLDIVDIHTHLRPPAWAPGGMRAGQEHALAPEIAARLFSPQALLQEFATNGVSLAVLSTTVESLYGAHGPVDLAGLAEANDWVAALAETHAGRVTAFGVTDAFAGEAGAREAERAIFDLGLPGLVIDSSRDGKFLGDVSVRPTLEVAARNRVPVFVHPVAHPAPEPLIAGAGALGNSLGRGLMNGVAFLSVLHSGVLEEFSGLTLIFATLGLGAIVQAARGGRFGRDALGERPNIYFDTMGDDPRIIRVLVDFFGAERVLAGTDWPILPALSQARLSASLKEAGLSKAEQRLVAGGNARRLLALRETSALAAE